MTRSVAQNIAKSKPRKNRRKREQTVLPKLYEIPGTSGGHYTDLTPEEYIACQKEHENFMLTAYLEKDPDYDKRQADDLSRQFFLNIQASRKEMADYELVEPMAVSYIFAWGCWARMNFKAKRKDADDSSTAIYFAELSVPDEEVTCLAKLDIDLAADNGAYKYCGYCHLDPEEKKEISIGGYGTVYHPVDANWKLGGRPED